MRRTWMQAVHLGCWIAVRNLLWPGWTHWLDLQGNMSALLSFAVQTRFVEPTIVRVEISG